MEGSTSDYQDEIQDTEIEGDRSSASSKRRRGPSSKVWKVFERIEGDISGEEKAKCKHCETVYSAKKESGTKNMLRHIDVCPKRPRDSGDLGPLNVDQGVFHDKLCNAIIKHNYPFRYVEHEGNREVFTYLCPDVKHISRNTAKAAILKKFASEREDLKLVLESLSSKVCLTTDLWTSITTDGYLALTAHYVDENWVLQKKILNFRHMPPPHNGPILGEKVINLLKDWGIEKKIFSLTLDNASCNMGLVGVLKSHMRLTGSLVCDGNFFHIRCGAHVLNLIVQAGLKVIQGCIHKVRESVKYVKASEGRKIKFARCIVQQGLDCKKFVCQDVVTRWNSTFLMLDSALAYRHAFYELALVDSNYKDCPSDEEWEKIKRIATFLQPFYEITTLFSGSQYPTANLYFRYVWQIESLLQKAIIDEDDDFKNMANEMKKKFDKYWECYSVVLSMAVVLDPRYKMQYIKFVFKSLDPSKYEEKAKEVRENLNLIFKEYLRVSTSGASSIIGDTGVLPIEMDAFDLYESEHPEENMIKSELECYLEEKRRDHKEPLKVLTYWEENRVRYPILSLLARDILSIPITSVASESAFSIGGRILGKYRTSLLPTNVEALLCTRDWLYGMPGTEEIDEEEELGVDFAPIIAHLETTTMDD